MSSQNQFLNLKLLRLTNLALDRPKKNKRLIYEEIHYVFSKLLLQSYDAYFLALVILLTKYHTFSIMGQFRGTNQGKEWI